MFFVDYEIVFDLSKDDMSFLNDTLSIDNSLNEKDYANNPNIFTKRDFIFANEENIKYFRLRLLDYKMDNYFFEKEIIRKDKFNYNTTLHLKFCPDKKISEIKRKKIRVINEKGLEVDYLENLKNFNNGYLKFIFKTSNPDFISLVLYLVQVLNNGLEDVVKLILKYNDLFKCEKINENIKHYFEAKAKNRGAYRKEINSNLKGDKKFYSAEDLLRKGFFQNSKNIDIYVNSKKFELSKIAINYDKKSYNDFFYLRHTSLDWDIYEKKFIPNLFSFENDNEELVNIILKKDKVFFNNISDKYVFNEKKVDEYSNKGLGFIFDFNYSFIIDRPLDKKYNGITFPPVFKKMGFLSEIKYDGSLVKYTNSPSKIRLVNNKGDVFYHVLYYIMENKSGNKPGKLLSFLENTFPDWENGLSNDEIKMLLMANSDIDYLYHLAKDIQLVLKKVIFFINENKKIFFTNDNGNNFEKIKKIISHCR